MGKAATGMFLLKSINSKKRYILKVFVYWVNKPKHCTISVVKYVMIFALLVMINRMTDQPTSH